MTTFFPPRPVLPCCLPSDDRGSTRRRPPAVDRRHHNFSNERPEALLSTHQTPQSWLCNIFIIERKRRIQTPIAIEPSLDEPGRYATATGLCRRVDLPPQVSPGGYFICRVDRDSVHTQYSSRCKRRVHSIALALLRCGHWTSLPLLRRCHWTRLPLLKAARPRGVCFEPGRCWEQVSLLR